MRIVVKGSFLLAIADAALNEQHPLAKVLNDKVFYLRNIIKACEVDVSLDSDEQLIINEILETTNVSIQPK